jgi:hypothetical protein
MSACPHVPEDVFVKELEHVLTHEIGHLYAEYKNVLDLDCSFLAAAGWTKKGLKLLPEKKRIAINKRALQLEQKKSQAESLAMLEGEAHKIGYPTIYSTTDPRESFAEFFAHLGRGSKDASVVKPSIINWFDENVFEKQTNGRGVACKR